MNKNILAQGRLKSGQMNKTEAAYAQYLEALKQAGEIQWYGFEAWKFRLADNTFYTPDFMVLPKTGLIEAHEVKGFMRDDANVKIKVAANMHPVKIILVKKAGKSWEFTTY